jgi:hypothetical protein
MPFFIVYCCKHIQKLINTYHINKNIRQLFKELARILGYMQKPLEGPFAALKRKSCKCAFCFVENDVNKVLNKTGNKKEASSIKQ